MPTAISSTAMEGALFQLAAWVGPASGGDFVDRRIVIIVASALFLLFLLAKLRPRLGRAIGRAKSRSGRSRAEPRAQDVDPAQALAEADASDRRTRRKALQLWVRAMRAAPASAEPIERAVDAFEGRFHRGLERALWQRLEELPWDAEHQAALAASADGLARLYARKRPAQALAMQKLARLFRKEPASGPAQE